MRTIETDPIAEAFRLGQPLEDAEAIDGGGVHRLWRLRTTTGDFAVKDLRVDKSDPNWLTRYLAGWELEERVSQLQTVAVARPVLTPDGAVVAAVASNDETRHVRVHEWVVGATPAWSPAPLDLATQVGRALAAVHRAGATLPAPSPETDEAFLSGRSRDYWLGLLANAADDVRDDVEAALAAILYAEAVVADAGADAGPLLTTHRDINQKNVLLRDGRPVVLDWDAAGPFFGRQELASVALTWGGIEVGEPDPRSVSAVVAAYFDNEPTVDRLVPHDVAGWLVAWLRFIEFNIRRTGGSADNDDQAAARRLLHLGIFQLRRFEGRGREWMSLLSHDL